MIQRNLITQDEIQTLEQIDRDCIRMHVCPPPKTFVSMEVQDGDGNVLDSFVMKSNSWVRNAYNICFGTFGTAISSGGGTTYGAGKMSLSDKTGTARQGVYMATGSANPTNVYGASNSNVLGIVIGTGTTAESFESYVMSAIVNSGTAAGQMAYSAETTPVFSYNGTTKKATSVRTRIFNNNSGASISINEVGLYAASTPDGATREYLWCRDLLSSAVTVPNAGQLTVTYTIEMTFPA